MNPLVKAILQEVRRLGLGFRGSGSALKRLVPAAVQVIDFQASSEPDRFYVNIGVDHPFLGAPEEWSQRLEKTLRAGDCALNWRLEGPQSDGSWLFATSTVAPVIDKLVESGLPRLNSFSVIPGPFADLTEGDVANLGYRDLVPTWSVQNAVTFLSRMHASLGDIPRALGFARLGLAWAVKHGYQRWWIEQLIADLETKVSGSLACASDGCVGAPPR